MNKVKPIIMSTLMVKALLDNRKTMTRRLVKPQPTGTDPIYNPSAFEPDRGWYFKGGGFYKPPYQPCDILYARETYFRKDCEPDCPGRTDADECPFRRVGDLCYGYRAQYTEPIPDDIKWRPSIFMPRSAARIWLRVKDVRCERLQSITPHDAWLEGCRIGNSFAWEDHIPELQQMCRDIMFRDLWDSINKKRGYGWDANPWVWVITFERIEQEVPK